MRPALRSLRVDRLERLFGDHEEVDVAPVIGRPAHDEAVREWVGLETVAAPEQYGVSRRRRSFDLSQPRSGAMVSVKSVAALHGERQSSKVPPSRRKAR